MNQYDLTIPTGSDFYKVFTIKQNGIPMKLGGYTATLYIIKDPGEMSSISFSTTSEHIINGEDLGTLTLSLTPADILTIDGNFYKLEIDDGIIQTEILTGNIFLLFETKPGIAYLIPFLRLKLGDINPLAYRYLDEWLKTSLIAAVRSLERYWGSKYIIADDGVITRNETYTQFEFEESDGIIQKKDEYIIVIKAALVVLEGSLENSAWSIGSWRDAEISYSNIQAGNIRGDTLKNLKAELDSLIKSPMKRLTRGYRATIIEEVDAESTIL